MATMTITTTAPEDARLAAAFGTYLNLGRNATAAEIKAAIVRWATSIVHQQELQVQQAAIAITDIAPS